MARSGLAGAARDRSTRDNRTGQGAAHACKMLATIFSLTNNEKIECRSAKNGSKRSCSVDQSAQPDAAPLQLTRLGR